MSAINVLSQEEKFIHVVDKFITHNHNGVNNNVFYKKLYVLFAGYHLKYFYSRAQYRNSCYHVDNIMQMFMGVVSTLKTPLLRQLANSDTLLHCLNSLVNYISGNLDEAEHIYADLLAQYEKKRIARSLACVFRSIRSRIGIEVRSAIRIHSINRELNFFYRFLTRFFAAFHYRGIFPQ